MKRYSPGASIHSDYCYICDCCEKDDGRPILFWEGLPDRKGHFVLCLSCIKKLYIEHISKIDKENEVIIVKRQVIPEKLRNKIFERDNNQCVKCNSKINLQLDHIIPFSMGGMTTEDNLQTLCKPCNLFKRDK
jgi:hypothetical protein